MDTRTSQAYGASHPGFRRSATSAFFHALLATALFRCWHILVFFTLWATLVSFVSQRVLSLSIESRVFTVAGSTVGFVIACRTGSSFDRYNEGRKLWSQIILTSRTLSRAIWFHVPDKTRMAEGEKDIPDDVLKARAIVEKKTAINLIEAFAVAVKHYLRGEDGIFYSDLYHLVKYLPAYALPSGIPSEEDLSHSDPDDEKFGAKPGANLDEKLEVRIELPNRPNTPLPQPIRLARRSGRFSMIEPPQPTTRSRPTIVQRFMPNRRHDHFSSKVVHNDKDEESALPEEENLFPAYMPPKWHFYDIFPLSILARWLTKKGKEVKGKRAAKLRAKLRNDNVSHNLPLEITFYLSSYIKLLQTRDDIPGAAAGGLIVAVNQLLDSLTGLERILTTPIPFSYRIHLWLVTIIYTLLLPLMLWRSLQWFTIPATTMMSFIFFGFLVAGEEIENPFGYDKNDLNLDHFTHNIIRNELRSLTSAPTPDPMQWAYAPGNDSLFTTGQPSGEHKLAPREWIQRGIPSMQQALAAGSGL